MHVVKVNFKSSLDTSLAKTKQDKTNKKPANLQILQKANANNKGQRSFCLQCWFNKFPHITQQIPKTAEYWYQKTQRIVYNVQNPGYGE